MAWELQSHMHQHLDSTVRQFIKDRTKTPSGKQQYTEIIDLLVTVCTAHLWEEGECFATIKHSIKDGTQPGFAFMEGHERAGFGYRLSVIECLIAQIVNNAIETATTDNGGHHVYLDRHGDWMAAWFIEEPI
tara:strand:- start:112 stop:507 length:396 start_codon:yes stop_codon:yes gene_type:complete